MRASVVLLALGALAVARFSTPTSAAEPPRGIAIRVYDYFGVPPGDIARARSASERILLTAGVQAEWRNCGPIVRVPVVPCDHPLTARQFVVRIQAARASAGFILGYSVIDRGRLAGQVATVFGDRIQQTSGRLRIDAGTLLGRVIAHEVGHLLMGTTTHTYEGVMSAHWSDTMLQRGTSVDWRFQLADANRVEQSLAERSKLPPAVITLAELRRLP